MNCLYEIHDVFISYVINSHNKHTTNMTHRLLELCAMVQTLTEVFDVYQAHITVFYEESGSLPEVYSELIHKKRNQYRKILQKVVVEGAARQTDFRSRITEYDCDNGYRRHDQLDLQMV